MGEVAQFPSRVEHELPIAVGAENIPAILTLYLPQDYLADVVPIRPDIFTIQEDLDTNQLEPEYARSVRAFEVLGTAALLGAEIEDPRNQLYQEYTSSLGEMLKGDEEKGEGFEITRPDEYSVANGKVVSYDGITPVIDLVVAGAEKSGQAAQKDERMITQHNRDKADVRNAVFVDDMVADPSLPNTRLVASIEPKEAMARDGVEFWEDLNYKEDLAFIQAYHRNKDGSLSTLTLSVDKSSKDIWRDLWGRKGVEIPEDETTDNWLDYALVEDLTDDEFENFAIDIRNEYYNLVPDTLERGSVEEIVEQNKELVDQVFEELYEPLAVALVTEKNSDVFREFAKQAMEIEDLSDEVRERMWRISRSETLDGEDVSILEQMIRYGLIEQLRISESAIQTAPPKTNNQKSFVTARDQNNITDALEYIPVPAQTLAKNIIGGISEGVREGRSHGSCGAVTKLGKRDALDKDIPDTYNPQEVFGGKPKDENDSTSDKSDTMECVNCPKCRTFHEELKAKDGKFTCKNKKCGYTVKA